MGGKVAWLMGKGGVLANEVAIALATNGADLRVAGEPGGLDLLVTFSQEDGYGPDELATGCRDAAAVMVEGGRILNIVSVTGLVAMRGDDTAPTQAAAMALTRTLALDLAPRGILVNALAVAPEATSQRMLSHRPGRREMSSHRVAQAALFLLDPANTYMTGHVLVADGGWTVGFGRDF